MRPKPAVWMLSISLTLLVVAVSPGVANADECQANVEHITFLNTPGGPILAPPLTLVLFEGILECVDLVVDNRTVGTAGAVAMTLQAFDGSDLSDSLVFFNTNNGPRGAAAFNMCFWSDDDGTGTNGGSTCDPMGKVIAAPGELLSAGMMTDTITGTPWTAALYSDPLPAGVPAGCPTGIAQLSDCGIVSPVPEPGTFWILAVAAVGLAWSLRRRVLAKPESRVIRTGALCTVVLGVAMLPGSQRTARAQTPPVHRTANETFAEIGRRAPDFGGMFVDDQNGTLYVYRVSGGRSTAADLNRAISGVLGPGGPRYGRIEILEGRYSFAQLKTWHDLMSPLVLAIQGAISTDINHAANHIRVGVEMLVIEPDIEAVLAQLSIPREAVAIEEVPPVADEDVTVPDSSIERDVPELIHFDLLDPPPYTCVAPCTLQQKIRPLLGGIQIQNDTGGICTYGFNAEMGLLRPAGPVTNSHCTNVKGGVEGTVFFQPVNTAANNQIAVETIDPCYWDPSRFPPAFPAGCMSPPHNPPFPLFCPAGSRCRLSDSAFGAFRTVTGGDVTFNNGFVAKPKTLSANNCLTPPAAPCDLSWDATATFRLVSEGLVIQGQTVNKVGRTTGWTRGAVSIVCGNFVGGGPVTQICQNRAGYLSAPGDSGSPVFVITNSPNANDVTLVGIHWGAGGISSPIGSSNDSTVSGVQNAAHELGPLTKCAPGFAPPFMPGC